MDSIDKIPPELVIEELKAKNPKIQEDIILDAYCANPDYLDLAMDKSLERMNISSLDCMIL